jgi:hypothetical protein
MRESDALSVPNSPDAKKQANIRDTLLFSLSSSAACFARQTASLCTA